MVICQRWAVSVRDEHFTAHGPRFVKKRAEVVSNKSRTSRCTATLLNAQAQHVNGAGGTLILLRHCEHEYTSTQSSTGGNRRQVCRSLYRQLTAIYYTDIY